MLAAAAARRPVATLTGVTVWPFHLWPAAKAAATANPESIRSQIRLGIAADLAGQAGPALMGSGPSPDGAQNRAFRAPPSLEFLSDYRNPYSALCSGVAARRTASLTTFRDGTALTSWPSLGNSDGRPQWRQHALRARLLRSAGEVTPDVRGIQRRSHTRGSGGAASGRRGGSRRRLAADLRTR